MQWLKQHMAQSQLQPREWGDVLLHQKCLAAFGVDLYWLLHLCGLLPFDSFLLRVDSADLCEQLHAQFLAPEHVTLARAMLADIFSYIYQQGLTGSPAVKEKV